MKMDSVGILDVGITWEARAAAWQHGGQMATPQLVCCSPSRRACPGHFRDEYGKARQTPGSPHICEGLPPRLQMGEKPPSHHEEQAEDGETSLHRGQIAGKLPTGCSASQAPERRGQRPHGCHRGMTTPGTLGCPWWQQWWLLVTQPPACVHGSAHTQSCTLQRLM